MITISANFMVRDLTENHILAVVSILGPYISRLISSWSRYSPNIEHNIKGNSTKILTWFVPERGIHQGAQLSMPLYQVYINDLLTQCRDSPFGATIGEIDVTYPATADDIAICALYKPRLNELVQIAYDYSIIWFFQFSSGKCLVIAWRKYRDPYMNV